MALDKAQIKSSYPLPIYNYRVTFLSEGTSTVVGFSEVSGLSSEYEPVTYKHGLSFALGHQIIPGMRQDIRLTLKRGIMASQDFLVHWMNQTYTEMSLSNARRDLLIDLCD